MEDMCIGSNSTQIRSWVFTPIVITVVHIVTIVVAITIATKPRYSQLEQDVNMIYFNYVFFFDTIFYILSPLLIQYCNKKSYLEKK